MSVSDIGHAKADVGSDVWITSGPTSLPKDPMSGPMWSPAFNIGADVGPPFGDIGPDPMFGDVYRCSHRFDRCCF